MTVDEALCLAGSDQYACIDTKRKADGISWREAAVRINVSASTLSRMQSGSAPDLHGFAAMTRWLGVSADEFIGPVRARDELVTMVMRRHLRQSRELGAKKAQAFMAIVEAAYAAIVGL